MNRHEVTPRRGQPAVVGPVVVAPVVKSAFVATRPRAETLEGPSAALDLQRRLGNRAALSILAAQASLTVGRSDDPYELEADLVARQVMASLDQAGSGSRPEVEPEERVARMIRRRPDMTAAPIGPEGGELGGELDRDLQAARSGGAPLPSEARTRMESAFGVGFGAVRVHEGPTSGELNRQLGASAFTVGRDIFFGGASTDLSSRAGQGLLAHELTHVVQQGAADQLDPDPA